MSNMVWTLERQRAERQHLRGRGDAQGSGPSPEASTTILEQRLPPSFGGAAGVSVHLYSIWLRGSNLSRTRRSPSASALPLQMRKDFGTVPRQLSRLYC